MSYSVVPTATLPLEAAGGSRVSSPHSNRRSSNSNRTPPPPPASSPPVVENSLPTAVADIPKGREATGLHDELDDSEAETVISSPVKLREAHKHAKAIKTENDDGNHGDDAQALVHDKVPPLQGSRQDVVDTELKAEKNERNGRTTTPDDSEHSDITSIHSSSFNDTRSSLERKASTGAKSPSHMLKSRERAERENTAGSRKQHLSADNSFSSDGRRSVDSLQPQHDRDDKQKWDTKHRSRDPSLSPARRPHRRTASMQSSLPEAHSHKKRRVMPTLGEKLVQSWDSDGSSSDSSTTVPRSVITRGSHRAVSTPGRSMPQAKRRVDYHGLTKLAKACEKGPLEAVQAALENDPGALDIADNDGNTPLQHVSLHGHKDIVEFLIGKNCRLDTFNISKHDTPLIDAVENSETDIVRVLLDAGVDPHCQNLEGNQPLDLLPDDDTKDEIEELLRAAIRKASAKSGSRPPLKHEQSVSQQPTAGPNLLYLDPNTKNLYKMAQIGDDKTVSEWIGRARVAPDHSCVKVAARGGHIICVRHLLAHIGEKDYEQYMLATIGRGHHAMVEFFIQQDDFDPTQRSEQTGKTYFEIAEERQGPNWQEERDALKDAYDKYIATHHGGHEPSSSPQVQKTRARTRGGPGGSLKVRKRGASGETIDRPKRKKLLSARVYRRDASSSKDEGEISSVVESHADMEMSPEPMLRESPVRLRPASQTRSGSSESHSQLLSRRSPSKRALPPPSAPEDKQLDTAMDLDHETAVAPLTHHSMDIESQSLTSQSLRSQDLPSGTDLDMTEEELAARLAEKEAEIEAERAAQRAAERALAEKRDAEVAAEAERVAAIERQQLEARRLQDIEDQRLQELEEAKRQAERAEQRQLMLDRLPNWIAAALQRKNEPARPSFRDSVLPVQVVKYLEIEPECVDEVQREEPWMLNVQAAAMLQWTDLTSGLEGTSTAEKWSTAEVTPAHRSIMFQALGGYRKLARADKDSYRKFLDMPDLYWVRFEDFLQAVKEQSKQDPSAANHDLAGLRWEVKGDYHVDWIPDPAPITRSKPQVNGLDPVEAAAPAQARHDTAMLDDGEILEAGPNKPHQMNGADPHLHTNGVASLAPPAVRAKGIKMVRRFALQLRESGVVGWVPVQKEFNRTKIKTRRFKGGEELVREEDAGV